MRKVYKKTIQRNISQQGKDEKSIWSVKGKVTVFEESERRVDEDFARILSKMYGENNLLYWKETQKKGNKRGNRRENEVKNDY